MKTKFWSKLIIGLFVLLVLSGGVGQELAASGTFRQGIDVDIKTWNPHMEQMNLRMIYFSPVYEGLVGEDENGNVTPLLATEWKQTPDSITFTLRDDVYFTDGSKFNAKVVKLNIESIKKGKFPATAAMLSAIKSVDVVDDTHVRFNLSRPSPSLLYNLQRFAGLMVSPADLGSEDLNMRPIGTGPWKLDPDKTVHNSKYVFTLNEKYWDPSQQGVAQVEIYYLPDYQAQLNAMMTGKLEASECTDSMIPQAKSAGFEVLMPESFHLGLHIMDREGKIVPEFADERVRKALALAIDRKAYFKAIERGGMPSTQRFLPGQYGHDEDIEDLTYNPKRAKALLKEAGVKNLTFEVPSFGPFDLWNEGIAGFFKKIGVTMKIKPITPGAIFSEPAGGKWAAALVPLNERHPEDFYNNRVAPKGFLNPFKIVEKDLEELAEKAKKLDRKSAEPIWSKICGQVAERGIIIHLDGFSTVIIVNTKKAQNVKPMYFMPGVVKFRGITVK
jgi:peptide/nickel transport system substrate-binding protein